MDYPTITIPDEAWQETGPTEDDAPDKHDPRSRLLTTIVINGTLMHLEAYALVDGDEQRFTSYFEEEDLAFFALTDSAVETTEIRGRTYALVATPHG